MISFKLLSSYAQASVILLFDSNVLLVLLVYNQVISLLQLQELEDAAMSR